MNHTKNISPWAWVPTLYFAQGIPYFIVNNISVMMFTKMGVPNGEMALFTSLLYLPWTIKPFWSPFVDIIKTKRWWTLSMQILMSVAFILLTLSIPRPDEATMAAGTTPISMFSITLMLFIITAFASATHDIAADGFYMLALKQSDQAAFVGIRSTFYRLASIFGQGVLVAIAGAIELRTENIPLSWTITMLVTAVLFSLVTFYHLFAVPKPTSDKSTLAADTQLLEPANHQEWIDSFRQYEEVEEEKVIRPELHPAGKEFQFTMHIWPDTSHSTQQCTFTAATCAFDQDIFISAGY